MCWLSSTCWSILTSWAEGQHYFTCIFHLHSDTVGPFEEGLGFCGPIEVPDTHDHYMIRQIIFLHHLCEQPHCWWCQENSHGRKCEGWRDLLGKGDEYNMVYGVLEREVKKFKAQEYIIVSIYLSIYLSIIYLLSVYDVSIYLLYDVFIYLPKCTHMHIRERGEGIQSAGIHNCFYLSIYLSSLSII